MYQVQGKGSLFRLEVEVEAEPLGFSVIVVLLNAMNEPPETETTIEVGNKHHALTPTALDDLSRPGITPVMI